MRSPAPSRRAFLKAAAAAGALIVFARQASPATASTPAGFKGEIGPFVRVNADNSVVIGAHVPDMGQGTFTSLPMLIAEELDVSFDRVTVEPMPLLLARNEKGQVRSYVGAGQTTAGGSNSVRVGYMPLRKAGARARRMILEAAAEQWALPVETLTTKDGMVSHAASGRRSTYGALAAAASRRPDPQGDLPLKDPKDFTIIGKPQRHRDADRIVRGEPLFGIDAEMPGMLHAVIARSPYLFGTAAKIDDTAARAVPGVLDLVPIRGLRPEDQLPPVQPLSIPLADGIAVVADSLWAAIKGRDALIIEWHRGPGEAANEDSAAAYRETWAKMEQGDGAMVRQDGDFDTVAATASRVIEARYESAMVAHACMEPPNALVAVSSDGTHASAIVTTQAPDMAASVISRVTGVDPLKVDVKLARLGGGFGRKFDQDMVAEAALIAKALRRPIRLVWTREDDICHDLYRPGACHLMQAAIDGDGKLSGWRHKLATHSRTAFSRGVPPQLIEYYPDGFPAHHVPNLRVDYYPLPSAAPRGSWRAPGHNVNCFAIECFLDEIAFALGRDPVEYRLELIGPGRKLDYLYLPGMPPRVFDTARLANVIRLAAGKSGWGQPLPKGHGRGIAANFTFETYAAEIVEVAFVDGKLTVERVTAAVDAGRIINPNGARAQIEGSIQDALSAALGQVITITDGQVEQSNFDSYNMMRIDRAARRIDVHFMGNDEPPTGLGEPGVPPLAPALSNAIFAASGRRIRHTPMLKGLEG
ncbi:molybdopterin cofactor-binding domain-containing protein [Niveispirillum sp. KHB5.9]|uniref:xanthine dehydrogenase family protein molybdopterin-binding subunit n=1 Tax=Niveispirillum sp. KHB5.9 TaxID=3400269 RepID=UPI003A8559E2